MPITNTNDTKEIYIPGLNCDSTIGAEFATEFDDNDALEKHIPSLNKSIIILYMYNYSNLKISQ